MAHCVADFLVRRTSLIWRYPIEAQAAAPAVARTMAELGWDSAREEAELAGFVTDLSGVAQPERMSMAKRESREELKARAARIAKSLAKLYPQARISLNFKTPWQCLAATIMSAQCTDERVNQVTPALFAKYPDLPRWRPPICARSSA